MEHAPISCSKALCLTSRSDPADRVPYCEATADPLTSPLTSSVGPPAGDCGELGFEVELLADFVTPVANQSYLRLRTGLDIVAAVGTRAFCEKVESRWDSRESVFVIQASHWTGGQHEWGSHIRMTCDAVSFKRLRLVIRTRGNCGSVRRKHQ